MRVHYPVVECLSRDRRVEGLNLTGGTAGLSKYRKDTQTTQRHTKTRKDGQRHTKTGKDTQKRQKDV